MEAELPVWSSRTSGAAPETGATHSANIKRLQTAVRCPSEGSWQLQ